MDRVRLIAPATSMKPSPTRPGRAGAAPAAWLPAHHAASAGLGCAVTVRTVQMTDGGEYTTTNAQVLRAGKPSGRSYRIYDGNENEFERVAQ